LRSNLFILFEISLISLNLALITLGVKPLISRKISAPKNSRLWIRPRPIKLSTPLNLACRCDLIGALRAPSWALADELFGKGSSFVTCYKKCTLNVPVKFVELILIAKIKSNGY